ncbi:RNA-guided endonuclease TnpB family protein [Megamonas hypermegale]|uniref:RNA-guided endonuclease TnpB family protein n=1 Tax=Megamonas hypermegale TaxID=158847 RepID=UPI0026EC722A|nr:RNA-guided endonuclease TnpB family protein [Megamonas hypermegale]
MEKAYKFRIYPNKTQEILLQKTFGCVRFIYNHFLDRRIKAYEQNKKNISYNECSKELTQLKKEKKWLKEPDKSSLQNALKHLDTAYKNFFNRPETGFPKFKSKKNRYKSYKTNMTNNFPKFKSKKNRYKSYKTNMTNNNIAFLGNKIKLPKLGKVKVRDKYCQIEGRILSATVSQMPSGKYYAALCCTDVLQPEFIRTDKYVGLDLGIKDFVITSDAVKYSNPKYLQKSLAKLAKLQRELSQKTKGSSNWEKARVKVAKLHDRIANQRRNLLHQISCQLIKNYDVICLEDLQVSNMMRNHKLARNIADVSWSEFVRQLKYKAEWFGKVIVKIDKFYPSSQLCHVCGYKNTEVKDLDVREWDCPECKTHHDRDVNAAINIRNEGLRILNIA